MHRQTSPPDSQALAKCLALCYSNQFGLNRLEHLPVEIHRCTVLCFGLRGLGSCKNNAHHLNAMYMHTCNSPASPVRSKPVHTSLYEEQLGPAHSPSTSPNMATIRDVTRPTKQPGYHVQLRWNPYLYQDATITYFLHIGGISSKNIYKEVRTSLAKIRTRLERLFFDSLSP